MKLEVGMYVRTKWGDIRKIERIWNDTDFNVDKTYYNYNIEEDTLGCVLNEDIIKEPSFDVTDLIKVGDYVNGEKVIRIFKPMFLSIGELPYIITTNNKYEEQDIKTVVTKEQFEQMSYKIGDK